MDSQTDRFRAVFDDCFRPLHAYARRRVTAADVDDVVSEVLMIAWRRLDDIPRGRELPWLYGVARRTVANHRRGDGRRTRLAARLAAEQLVRSTGVSGDDEVSEALARLAPNDREILRLHAWEGLAAPDLAIVLGCSENAAALRLSRARKKFRDEMTAFAPSRTQASRKVTDV